MIVIEPLAGLCNRMRALDSAIWLARKLNRELRVVWNQSADCNCGFNDLFVVPRAVSKIKERRRVSYSRKYIPQRYLRKLVRKFLYDKCIYNDEVHELMKVGYDFEKIGVFKSVFISTYGWFFNRSTRFEDFTPIEPLQEIIHSYTNDFGDVVGVHIRRTDNKISIDRSLTSMFIEMMSNEIDKNNDVRFFLATDSLAEEERLDKVFPGRIITHRKASLDRNDPRAIQDALIDLYCLSKCRKLLGSYQSSFSITAATMNQIDLVMIENSSDA